MAKKKQQIPITPQMQAEFNRYSQILSDTPIAPTGLNPLAQNTTPTQSYGKITMDDINKAISGMNNNEIPSLQQTPSIQSELTRMEKAKSDTTTPRTEGEQKAIDTYYNGLKEASKQNTTPDYNAEIKRMQAMKADTTAQRTPGEEQAIDTYLAGLLEAQKYVNSQKKVSQTVSQKKNVSQKKTDKEVKEEQLVEQDKKSLLNEAINSREQAMRQAYDKQQLKNAQNAREKDIQDAYNREHERKALTGLSKYRDANTIIPETKDNSGSGGGHGYDQMINGVWEEEAKRNYKKLQDLGYSEEMRPEDRAKLEENLKANNISAEEYNKILDDYLKVSPEGAAVSFIGSVGQQLGRIPVLLGALNEATNANPLTRELKYGVAGNASTYNAPSTTWRDASKEWAQAGEKMNEINPVASTAGNMAGSMILYGGANEAVEGLLGQLGPIKNIIIGQGIDNVLDTTPELAMNYANGKYTNADGTTNIDSIALDWAISNGINLLGNVGGELLANGFNKQSWSKDLADIANDNRGSFIGKARDIDLQDALKETGVDVDDFVKQNPEYSWVKEAEAPKAEIPTVEQPKIDVPQNTNIAPKTVAENTSAKIPTTSENVDKEIADYIEKKDYLQQKAISEAQYNPLESVKTFDELNKLTDDMVTKHPEYFDNGNYVGKPKTVAENAGLETPTITESVPAQTNPIEETLAEEFPVYQTENMRARQNGLKVSNEVPQQPLTNYDMTQEKQTIRDYVDNLNMSDEKRVAVSEQLDKLDKVLDDFNNATTNDAVMKSMDDFEKIYSDINKELSSDVTYTEYLDNGLSAERKVVRDALQGKRIVLPKEWQSEFPDSTLKEINQSIYMGPGSGRFVRNATNGASTIDSSFAEINDALGGRLTNYMVSNGLDPDVPQNQAKALVDYLSSFKGQSTNSVREVAYDGGLLDDTFQNMIQRASERGIEIDENALRKRMRVSDFRAHNQGNLGLTDEELNNSYFSTNNKNFQFLKGDRSEDTLRATENLTRDYEGTKQKLLNKPVQEGFTPQEVDEAFMAFQRELDANREIGNGDYSSSAEMLYRLTQDAHDKGAGLQAYAKWKANTPVGVVLDSSSTARDFAVSKFGQDYIDDIDKLVKDIKKVADSDLSFEEQAREVERLMRELQSKGYKNGVDGFEQMKELLTTSNEIKSMVYEDLKKAGRVVTMEDFENMLKSSSYEQIATDLRRYGKILTKDDYDTMLKSGKNIDAITIKDLLYAVNDIPNIDAKSQMDILNLAEEMYGKNLSVKEKQQYINKINVILSKQKGWSKKDKAIELSHIMMLSGTKTHIKNFVANVGMLPQEALARKVSALGQNAYHLINPDYKPTQAFHVSKQSNKLAADYLESIGGVDALLTGTTDKYSGKLAQNLGANYMYTFKKEGQRNVVAKANDYLTEAIPSLKNVENAIGNKANSLFKKIGSEGAYSTLSGDVPVIENARQLVYESLGALEDNPFVKTNFEKRLASFIEAQKITNISDIPKEAIDIAKAEALKATFKDDNAITSLFSSIKKVPVVGETLLPYVKTPANLLARSIDYSPIGIARSLYGMINSNSRFAQATIGEAIDELAKGIGGTSIGLLGMYLYANDILSGAAPEDNDEKKFLQEQGWQEYSVSTKGVADFINDKLGTDIDLGDDYISYSWLQPSTTNMIASTMLYDELSDGEDITDKSIEDIATRLKKLGGAYVNSLLEQSTLQDVGNLFDTSYGQGVGENFIDSLIQMPTRYFSGAITSATQLSDDNKREYYSKGKPIETAINLAKSKIPGLSETLPKKYDAFGNEITRNTSESGKWINTLINPANTTHPTDEPMYAEIDKVNKAAAENAEEGAKPKEYIPTYPTRTLTLSDESNYNLDNEEYSMLNKSVGETRKDVMQKFIDSELYNSLSADEKVDILNDIDKLANSMGALEVTFDNAKISKENQKLVDIYNNDGPDELLNYLSLNSKAKSSKGKSLGSMGVSDLYNTLAYEKISDEEKGRIVARENSDNENYLAIQDALGEKGVWDFEHMKYVKDIKNEGVPEYQRAMSYLDTTSYTAEEKGMMLAYSGMSLTDAAKANKEKGHYKEIYDEYAEKLGKEKIAAKWEKYGLTGKDIQTAYDTATNVIPTLDEQTFATTRKAIDANGENGVSQTEMIDYLNSEHIKSSYEGEQLWSAYYGSEGKYIPVLENGTWKKKKKK